MIEKGEVITDDFIIEEIVQHKHSLALTFKKDTEKYQAILKDNIDIFLRTYKKDDHVICQAKARKKKDEIILDIIYVKRFDMQSIEETKFKSNPEKFIEKIDGFINSVKDTDYKSILDVFFKNEGIREAFFESPAAKDHHHNYEFGLLEHTVEVLEIAIFLGEYFSPIDRDLLITGCVLHDVGKIKSYEIVNNEIVKTDWEKFCGHLSLSAMIISKMMPQGIDSVKAKKLYHLILSHHGKKEWGSPVECQIKEAQILSQADLASAYLNQKNWEKN